MKPYILVIDDEPDICSSVKDILEDEGYQVATAENGEAARRLVRQRTPELMLLDIWMPDIDGISLLKEFSGEMDIKAPVVMMSGHGTVETAMEATRLGARDFIEKPLSLAKLIHTVEHVLREDDSNNASQEVHLPVTVLAPVGKSAQMQLLREHMERLSHHDSTVLISGEPGSGKTFCASFLHARSSRKQGPFVNVQTRLFHDGKGAELLFGFESQAEVVPGFLEQAQGGTLFIDDIAELDEDLQRSLFAALHSNQWVRINGTRAHPLDVRIIAATRYNLEQEVRAGRFSEELYHFLNVAPLQVPPLRDHVEDITELVQYFLHNLVEQEHLPYRAFSVAAQNRLRNYEWPGNVRQLKSLIRRLLVLGFDSDVELDEIEAVLSTSSALVGGTILPEFDLPLRQAREQFERAYLEFHMRQADGNVGKVAKQIGMERTHLYRKMRSLGIEARRATREK